MSIFIENKYLEMYTSFILSTGQRNLQLYEVPWLGLHLSELSLCQKSSTVYIFQNLCEGIALSLSEEQEQIYANNSKYIGSDKGI